MKNFVFGLIVAMLFFVVVLISTNHDSSSAVKQCEQALQQNAYCSGYHYEKGDGKYYIYFRDKQDHDKIVTIVETIDHNIAEQYYQGE